jgi:GT2 family glycosyltransferase
VSVRQTIGVGIASFNGRALLQATLPSFAAQTLTIDRIVVVDDGSTDGTPQWLAQTWPDVRVIEHETNRGITAALNSCLRELIDLDFVCLFNNDVEVAPGCLAELVDAMQRDRNAAAAGPKLLNYTERDLVDGAGDTYAWSGMAGRRGHGERDLGQYDTPGHVFGVCGGAAVFRREALLDVGLFDEDFEAYYEDVDWSFRAQLAGYHVLYVPSAMAYHMSSATVGRGMTPFMTYHTWRNAIWIVVKDWPVSAIARNAHRLVLTQLAQAAWAVTHGRFVILLRAWRDAVAGLPVALRKRGSVQQRRRVSRHELRKKVSKAKLPGLSFRGRRRLVG